MTMLGSTKPLNILYLSYDGMTDPLGQSQVLPYLFGIVKAGHRITLVSFEKPERFEKQRVVIQSLCDTHNIRWVPMAYTKRPPVLSTLLDVNRMQRLALTLHRNEPFDVVHCRSYIAALVGLKMKRKHNVKFVFDMRGFWADERVEGNLWKLSNPLYKTVYTFFKKKEIQFISEADAVVSLTQNAADDIKTWKSFSHQPVFIDVIPCCADVHFFNPETVTDKELADLRKQFNIDQNEFVLSYTGSLGTWYMLDEMLEFFKALLSQNHRSKFLIVTNDLQNDLVEKAKRLNIPQDRIVMTNAQRNDMPRFIALSHATLFFVRPTFSKKASSPVKQGEAMAMGIPIVCNAGVGDTDQIVGDKHGIVLHEMNAAQYALVAERLLQSHFSKDAIRRYAVENLSLEEGVKRYLNIYNRIAS